MSANYLEANLNRLFQHDPATADALRSSYRPDYPEIRYTKDGLPIPVVDHKCLHSLYHPQGEARKWVESLDLKADDPSLFVLGGLGFGYHVIEILRVIAPDQLVAVEPDLSLAAAMLAYRLPEAFPAGFKLVVGKSPVQAYCDVKESTPAGRQIRCITHPASARRRPEYYNALAGIFKAQDTAARGGYKILLVSPIYGGSQPVADYVQRALNLLGHRCEVLDNTVFYPGLKHLQDLTSNRAHRAQLQGLMTALLAESITARAMETGADLVLGLAQAPFTTEVLQELQKAGILTAFWFIEDGGLFKYWKNFAPLFDHYFVIQKEEFLSELGAAGCKNPHYLPLAADPDVHRPLDLSPQEQEEFGSDISHVGAGYHNRRQVFTTLLDYDFKLWGNDWDDAGPLAGVLQRRGERLSAEDSVKVFNASRINLNLHSSTYHEAVNPFGDYLNPRTYEIACCGAFQLVDERRYLAENFQVGEEIAAFHDLKELRDKTDYYLASPQERIQIAHAGRGRVLREHTYRHRLLELLGAIAGAHPDWKPRAGGLPTAEEIIAQAGADSELGCVMQRFLGRGPLTLENVSAEIERNAGELSRTEALILLLNEFRRWGLEKGVL